MKIVDNKSLVEQVENYIELRILEELKKIDICTQYYSTQDEFFRDVDETLDNSAEINVSGPDLWTQNPENTWEITVKLHLKGKSTYLKGIITADSSNLKGNDTAQDEVDTIIIDAHKWIDFNITLGKNKREYYIRGYNDALEDVKKHISLIGRYKDHKGYSFDDFMDKKITHDAWSYDQKIEPLYGSIIAIVSEENGVIEISPNKHSISRLRKDDPVI